MFPRELHSFSIALATTSRARLLASTFLSGSAQVKALPPLAETSHYAAGDGVVSSSLPEPLAPVHSKVAGLAGPARHVAEMFHQARAVEMRHARRYSSARAAREACSVDVLAR